MPSILRRVLTLGLAAGSIWGGLLLPQKAWALSTEDVLQKLASIPVFVVANNQGAYITNRLVGRAQEGEQQSEVALLYVFFSGEDAEEYVTLEQQQNPDFQQQQVSVGWVELAALYQQARVEREIPLRLLFVPESEEVTAATEINSEFDSGVPLFAPKYRSDGSYLLLPVDNINNGEPVVPIFFSQSDLESVLDLMAESNPELRAQIEIEVVSLEGLISQLEDDDSDSLNRIWLFPDSDVYNYIRSRQSER
jgi:hypothetical protein